MVKKTFKYIDAIIYVGKSRVGHAGCMPCPLALE